MLAGKVRISPARLSSSAGEVVLKVSLRALLKRSGQCCKQQVHRSEPCCKAHCKKVSGIARCPGNNSRESGGYIYNIYVHGDIGVCYYAHLCIDRYWQVWTCMRIYIHAYMHMHTCMHACIHEVQRCLYRYKSYTDTDNIHIHIHMQYATCHMPYATCNMQHTIQIQIHIYSCVCMYTKSHTHTFFDMFPFPRYTFWDSRVGKLEQDLAKEI